MFVAGKYVAMLLFLVALTAVGVVIKKLVDHAKEEAVSKAILELQVQYDEAIREASLRVQNKLHELNVSQTKVARNNLETERRINSSQGAKGGIEVFSELVTQLNSEIGDVGK